MSDQCKINRLVVLVHCIYNTTVLIKLQVHQVVLFLGLHGHLGPDAVGHVMVVVGQELERA